MNLVKRVLVTAATAVLILVPTLTTTQAGQAGDAVKKTEGYAKDTVKKTEQHVGEATGTSQRAKPTVSESEIAAAKASGKVWVNTATGVYHKEGQWYGATKHGKFMTENDAIKAGYKASKGK